MIPSIPVVLKGLVVPVLLCVAYMMDGMHAGNADVPFELHRQPSCLCRFLNSSARNRTSPFPFSCHAPHSSRRSVCVRG